MEEWLFFKTVNFQGEVSHQVLEVGALPLYLVDLLTRGIPDGIPC